MSLELFAMKYPGWIANKILQSIVDKNHYRTANISDKTRIHVTIVEEVLEQIIHTKPEWFRKIGGIRDSKFGIEYVEGGKEALIDFLRKGGFK
jgi:hypothetical protein